MQETWLQCEGTWFVGVDALPTAPDGAMAGVPLAGPAIDALAPMPKLHPAQLSVTFPGYPRPRAGESAAAFRYRRDRDGAHVDGLLPFGAKGPEDKARRRRISEPHAFILGLPLTRADADASPLVVWQGSHAIIRRALLDALAPHPRESWDKVDITEAYTAARRVCFDTCPRVPLLAAPGEALLLDRALLHGIAPWQAHARAEDDMRMIAYFRPVMAGGVAAWIAD